jgi:prepilin-type N-terminal cleavage/methylation domain-containing protein
MLSKHEPGESTGRRGFTLAEALITIALIAAVAAVVIPTIAGQLAKADPQRVGNDAYAIRGAAEQFLNDVGQYPGNITHLTTRIVSGTSAGPIYGVYGVSERDRWKGPYLTKDATAVLQTGFNLPFNTLFNVDTLGASGLSEATATNPRFLTLCFAIDSLNALKIDAMFDDNDLTTGLFRWTVNVAGVTDTLKFLMLPIQ